MGCGEKIILKASGTRLQGVIPVGVGDEPPEVLDAVGAIVGDFEEDGREPVVDANVIVIGGLSCDGEEGRCGGSEG